MMDKLKTDNKLNEFLELVEANLSQLNNFELEYIEVFASEDRIAELHNLLESDIQERHEKDNLTLLFLNEPIEIGQHELNYIITQVSDTEEYILGCFVSSLDDFVAKNADRFLIENVVEDDSRYALGSIDELVVKFTEDDSEQEVEEEQEDNLVEIERNAKLRVMADFQNYKKRIEKEREELMGMANKRFLNHALDVIDDFTRALKHEKEKDTEDYKSLMSGCEMILDKFRSLVDEQDLEELGIKIGDKFDPTTMQALTTIPVESEKQDNTVIHVDQKGYKNKKNNQIYRTAKVVIGKFN